MAKIKDNKVYVSVKRTGTLIKQNDNKFNGKHPNNVNVGRTIKGIIITNPTIGFSCRIDDFITSKVTEIVYDDGITCTFNTLNSTYKLVRNV